MGRRNAEKGLISLDVFILAIGKIKPSPEKDLIDKYVRQTRRKVVIREFEDKKSGTVEERMKREAAWLLQNVPSGAKVVVADERGKTMGSVEFAEKIRVFEDGGAPAVCFLIGGADGHDESVRQRADLLLAFGKMTWPHFLARVMLVEQIYRAQTILDGHPYHRA